MIYLSYMLKISLIKLKPNHFKLFNRWWNDPELRRWTSGTNEAVKPEAVVRILSRHLTNKNGFDFIITAKRKPIGHILIQRKKTKKHYEVYIAIGEKRYWGRGIGTVAMQQAVNWFFKNFPREKNLYLEVLPKNIRAIRCYQKVGFKKIRLIKPQKSPSTWLMVKLRE